MRKNNTGRRSIVWNHEVEVEVDDEEEDDDDEDYIPEDAVEDVEMEEGTSSSDSEGI